jgi:hypothetical protein
MKFTPIKIIFSIGGIMMIIMSLLFIGSYFEISNLNIDISDSKFIEDNEQSSSFNQLQLYAIENTQSNISFVSNTSVIYSSIRAKCEEMRCISLHLIVGTQAIPALFLPFGDAISAVTEYGFDFSTQTYSAITWSYPTVNGKDLISSRDMEVGLTQAFTLIMDDERFLGFAGQNAEFDMLISWGPAWDWNYKVTLYNDEAYLSFQILAR